MTDRRTKQMLELIGKMKEIEMFDPLPSEEKRYAARMLRNVESAIKSNDAPAAALFMLVWAENFYGESIRTGEQARKEKISAVVKLNWLWEAQSLRVETPKISTLKIAKMIAPTQTNTARNFLMKCENSGKLNKKLP